uniref:Uncharacterized protein n=1 Tax=Arundo donax TaxID=35708 RepID=A0A0A8ZCR5_ARUDO
MSIWRPNIHFPINRYAIWLAQHTRVISQENNKLTHTNDGDLYFQASLLSFSCHIYFQQRSKHDEQD